MERDYTKELNDAIAQLADANTRLKRTVDLEMPIGLELGIQRCANTDCHAELNIGDAVMVIDSRGVRYYCDGVCADMPMWEGWPS